MTCVAYKKLLRRNLYLKLRIRHELDKKSREHNAEWRKLQKTIDTQRDKIRKLEIEIETYEYELTGYKKHLERKEIIIKEIRMNNEETRQHIYSTPDAQDIV